MAKQVQKFQSDAGGLFDSECAALKDDLRHQIMQVIQNEKMAKDLAESIVDNMGPSPEFIGWSGLIAALSKCAPPDTRAI